jgi:hypothetical protein
LLNGRTCTDAAIEDRTDEIYCRRDCDETILRKLLVTIVHGWLLPPLCSEFIDVNSWQTSRLAGIDGFARSYEFVLQKDKIIEKRPWYGDATLSAS